MASPTNITPASGRRFAVAARWVTTLLLMLIGVGMLVLGLAPGVAWAALVAAAVLGAAGPLPTRPRLRTHPGRSRARSR